MDSQEIAEQAKKKNIIDMAVGFTAMSRLFRSGSAKLIKEHLTELLDSLDEIESGKDFRKMHEGFCEWFLENITPAKGSGPPSYGQAAKIFDIVLKVYVYYCKLPNPSKAEKLILMLNGGIDTPIFRHLFKQIGHPGGLFTLKKIDKELYDMLQALLRLDIEKSFHNSILPVQYDDIMWRRLNR